MHINWFLVLLLAILVIGVVALGGMACSSATFSPFAHKWDDVYTGNFTSEAVDLNLTTGNGSITCRTWSGPGYKLIVHTQALEIGETGARRSATELIRVEHGDSGIKVSDGPKAMASIELLPGRLPAQNQPFLHAF